MTLDPRTPILVGGGQLNRREDPLEPVDLIATAARLAADEAGAPALLAVVDSVAIVKILSWKYADPGSLVGARIGARPGRSAYTGDGGSNPQALVNRAAADIAAGRSDVALIGGAEAWRTRMKLRAAGLRPEWTVQGEDTAPAPVTVPDVPMRFEGQTRVGLDRPAHAYPLFEEAIRRAAGRTRDAHIRFIGELWARFSDVAAGNPNAWIRQRHSAEEIITPSRRNRLVAFPYTKLLNSNNSVEQGAAVLLCSVDAASRYRVPRENWIFIHGSVEASDRCDIGERPDLSRSPAIRAAGRKLFAGMHMSAEDLDLVDLYSCFPSAVEVAARELGLPLTDSERPLTVTGGLTFAGGPWNNYGTHAIATLATRLRETGAGRALATGNSGYLTKHALAIYGVQPPPAPFRWESAQEEVDREPRCRSLTSHEGEAAVDVSTVVYDRQGQPAFALFGLLTGAGERCFAKVDDAGDLAAIASDGVHAGQIARVSRDGTARLVA